MRVELLGSGAGDGWPNPWCGCDSCAWARAEPARRRHQTSALVDGSLLVDAGTALHRGGSLHHVRTVLFTHAHPDHADPQLLLWRQAAMAAGASVPPLEIAGPPAALDPCRHWVDPAEPVTWTPLRAGDKADLASGHRVVAMAANHWAGTDSVGPALLYVLNDRVLVGWDTAAPYRHRAGRPGSTWFSSTATTATAPRRPTTTTWPTSRPRWATCGRTARSARVPGWWRSASATPTRPVPTWNAAWRRAAPNPATTAS